jgi:hypothetical protein
MADIRRLLDELSANRLIAYYDFDGVEYFQVLGWYHQKIDRPQRPKYPAPVNPLDECSPNTRRTFAPDRIGEDTKGREREKGTLKIVSISKEKEEGVDP